LIHNLTSPDKPSDKPFKDLVEVMTKHFCLPPSEIVQQYKFNLRVFQDDESVAVCGGTRALGFYLKLLLIAAEYS